MAENQKPDIRNLPSGVIGLVSTVDKLVYTRKPL